MVPPAADSDSDDQERPKHEPEFVIHVVDDHRPPAPPVQMHRLAPPLFRFPPEPPQFDYDGDGRSECTYFLAIKVICFALMVFMVIMTLGPATQLPKEYRKSGHGFMVLGPIIIGVVALLWIVLDIFDKERC
ncbi:hypothetical protein EJB05_15142, partial [Eragrostis curvula]